MRTGRLTSCFELLQKLKATLESCLTGLSPKYFITDLSNAVLLIWFTLWLVLVSILVLISSMCFYDICSDGIVTVWEGAAHSLYNMFSVPCQEKIIESEQGRRS